MNSPMPAHAAMPEIERIIRRHLDWPVERDRDGAISAAMHDIVRDVQDLFAPILAAALAAERERCAKVAEDHGALVSNEPIGKACSRNIAAAIRAGE